jgi:hypothetical protein
MMSAGVIMQFDLVATRATVDLAERDGKWTFLRK